jgi:hypothetical protein
MSKALEAAAAKLAKASAAALFARAVPQTSPPPMGQVATMSGWSVPPDPAGATPQASPQSMAPSSTAPSSSVSPRVPPDAPSAVLPPSALPSSALPSSAAAIPVSPRASDASPGLGATPTSVAFEPSSPSLQGRPGQPPTVAPRKSDLPFTRRQMLVGGGALFGVIVLVAIIAGTGGGDKKQPTKRESGDGLALVPDLPKEDPVPQILEDANQMIAADDPERAISMLAKARRTHPDNAQLALVMGKANFAQLYWTEGVKNFRDAIRLDSELRGDVEMLKTVLKGFLTTPDVDDRIAHFMRNDVRDDMKPMLEETAAKHPNKQLRARAKAELRHY